MYLKEMECEDMGQFTQDRDH